MDKKDLESKKLPDLKEIAKTLAIPNFESLKKADLINLIVSGNAVEKPSKPIKVKTEKVKSAPVVAETKTEIVEESIPAEIEKPKRNRTIKKVAVAEEVIIGQPDLCAAPKVEEVKSENISEVKVENEEITENTEKPAFVKRPNKPNPHPSKLLKQAAENAVAGIENKQVSNEPKINPNQKPGFEKNQNRNPNSN